MTMILFILHVLTVKMGKKFQSQVLWLRWLIDGVHTVFSFTRSDEKFHHRKLQVLQEKRNDWNFDKERVCNWKKFVHSKKPRRRCLWGNGKLKRQRKGTALSGDKTWKQLSTHIKERSVFVFQKNSFYCQRRYPNYLILVFLRFSLKPNCKLQILPLSPVVHLDITRMEANWKILTLHLFSSQLPHVRHVRHEATGRHQLFLDLQRLYF